MTCQHILMFSVLKTENNLGACTSRHLSHHFSAPAAAMFLAMPSLHALSSCCSPYTHVAFAPTIYGNNICEISSDLCVVRSREPHTSQLLGAFERVDWSLLIHKLFSLGISDFSGFCDTVRLQFSSLDFLFLSWLFLPCL